MKKGVLILVFVLALVLFSAFSFAATNSSNSTNSSTVSSSNTNSDDLVKKGYSCLTSKIDGINLTLTQATVSLWALGNTNGLVDKVNSQMDSSNCWPKGACKLKDTAMVLLAYNSIGKDTSDIQTWINSKNATASTNLNWYLQIDIGKHSASNCTISYDDRKVNVNILDNMKLQVGSTSCLAVSSSGYWLTLSGSCLDKSFDISCSDDFITNLIYQKRNSEVIYVSSDTHASSIGGTTTEQVKSKCLKTGSACDYEGTLWGAWALQKSGNNIDAYLPYLISGAEDSPSLFPDAFLYMIDGSQDYYSNIIASQRQNKYWQMSGSDASTRYYDTSLALMSLANSGGNEVDNTKSYLLSVQDKSGCWNNGDIKSTALVLASAWPENRVTSGGTGTSSPICESSGSGYSCENRADCLDAGGQILYNFDCSSSGSYCCSVKVELKSCSSMGGLICADNQVCPSDPVKSLTGACCMANACLTNAVQEDTCIKSSGTCRNSCFSDEEQVSEVCADSSEMCCSAKVNSSSGGINWFWIILLIILIALVVLLIIYRDKAKIWWYSIKNKKDKKKPDEGSAIQTVRPGLRQPGRPIPQGQMGMPIGRAYSQQVRRPVSQKDKELEETLKKLRDMSK